MTGKQSITKELMSDKSQKCKTCIQEAHSSEFCSLFKMQLKKLKPKERMKSFSGEEKKKKESCARRWSRKINGLGGIKMDLLIFIKKKGFPFIFQLNAKVINNIIYCLSYS